MTHKTQDNKTFPATITIKPWWDIEITMTLPPKAVEKRLSGKLEFEYHVVTYSFGKNSMGEYIEVYAVARNGASKRRQRIYASGKTKHLPPTPDSGVCENCGDELPKGHTMCTECVADMMFRGIEEARKRGWPLSRK